MLRGGQNMEITDFLTQNFLSSFTGTLVAVELIVFITKSFPIIKKIPTKLYTFMWAVVHLIIVKVASGVMDLNVECIYRLFINSLVVTLILCGGYDTIMQKINIIKNINGNLKDNIEVKNIVNNDKNSDVVSKQDK